MPLDNFVCDICNNTRPGNVFSTCSECGNRYHAGSDSDCEGYRSKTGKKYVCILCGGPYPHPTKDSNPRVKLPKHTLNTKNGWLTPDGLLYPCSSWGHSSLYSKIVENY